ncbi:MAG: RND family efflux transporter MFP subunit [Candidatus Endobugula sp.]
MKYNFFYVVRKNQMKRHTNPHKGSVNVIVILLIGALIAAALYWFRPQPTSRPSAPSIPPVVSVMLVNPQTQTLYVNTQGTVEPRRAIQLIAEVSGRVSAVNTRFADGGIFADGDTLLTLDDRDDQYRLIEAEAQIAAAIRELALEKGQARQAKREWRDLGNAEANALALRKPQVNAAQAQLSAARAQQDIIRLRVQRSTIQAPFVGRASRHYVDTGQYVVAGETIADIYDSETAEIHLPLSDKQVAFLGLPLGTVFDKDEQRPVVVSATVAGQTRQWQARLVRTGATVDDMTRFYSAVVRVQQPFDRRLHGYPLVMGLFVDAAIEGRVVERVMSIPEKSLVDKQWVYIVKNERIQRRSVKRVRTDGIHVWVQGELSAGDQLVISDPRVLEPGMQVTVVLPP